MLCEWLLKTKFDHLLMTSSSFSTFAFLHVSNVDVNISLPTPAPALFSKIVYT